MRPYQIILLVLVLLLFVYVGALLVILTNAFNFNSRLRKRRQAIAVLLSEKKEVLLAWSELFREEGYRFEKEDEEAVEEAKQLDFKFVSPKQTEEDSSTLKELQRRLTFLSSDMDWDGSEKDYEDYVSTLHDLETNYRQSSAIYNADVNAYNYWISIPGFRWLLWLVGFRKKKAMF